MPISGSDDVAVAPSHALWTLVTRSTSPSHSGEEFKFNLVLKTESVVDWHGTHLILIITGVDVPGMSHQICRSQRSSSNHTQNIPRSSHRIRDRIGRLFQLKW